MRVCRGEHHIVMLVQIAVKCFKTVHHLHFDDGRDHAKIAIYIDHSVLVAVGDDESTSEQSSVNTLRVLATFSVAHLIFN